MKGSSRASELERKEKEVKEKKEIDWGYHNQV